MGFTAILAAALALPPPHAAKSLPALRRLPPAVVAHLEPVLPMTAAEAKAIDRRFWQANRWRLCPASCGMICAKHGSEWLLERGEADPDDSNQRPAEPTEIKPAEAESSTRAASGHWERQCGPAGCSQVWINAPPEREDASADNSSSQPRFRLRRR